MHVSSKCLVSVSVSQALMSVKWKTEYIYGTHQVKAIGYLEHSVSILTSDKVTFRSERSFRFFPLVLSSIGQGVEGRDVGEN